MLNTFNLFLLLFAWWGALIMAHEGVFSWFYIFFGIIAAFIISTVAGRAKMIKKDSEMIYFDLGFYRHFFLLLARNFIPSLKLLYDMAILHRRVSPVLAKVKFSDEKEALFISSLNIVSGVICVGTDQNLAVLHAVNHECLRADEIKKIRVSLKKINDSEL